MQLSRMVMLDHKFAERAERMDRRKSELGTKQGHGKLLLTEDGRVALMKNVFKPLLQQIGEEKPANLVSFELVNESESLIEDLSTDRCMQMAGCL